MFKLAMGQRVAADLSNLFAKDRNNRMTDRTAFRPLGNRPPKPCESACSPWASCLLTCNRMAHGYYFTRRTGTGLYLCQKCYEEINMINTKT